MFGKTRRFTLIVAFAAALVMLFVLSSVAFAGSTTTTDDTVCVDGYVINHRELPVDGTKTTPELFVEAIGADGAYTETAAVGSDGYFEFEELPAGMLNFKMQLPRDWEGIVPLAERDAVAENGAVAETGATEFDAQEKCYRIVFKIRRVFGVMVVKWEELLDGTVQPGVDWDITAIPVNDPFVKSQTDTTDEKGRTGFTLTAGSWIIRETVKSGWKPITPSQVTLTLDQYGAAGARPPVVFKNLEPPCKSQIDVQKIGWGTDANGEPVELGPLAGWKVMVSRADGTMVPIVKVTDGSGKAIFDGLLPGVYEVKEKVQIGWEVMSDNPQTVVHMDCETTTVIFENKEVKGPLSISGRKLFKAWVPPYKGTVIGLPGWVMTATLVGTDIMTTTVTDALGNYSFTEAQLEAAGIAFPGASVKVCEESRDNWIHLTPECVTVKFPYPVPVGYEGETVNFTNAEDPPLASARATTAPATGCRVVAIVAQGQTLGSIAARYGSSVWGIARANNIRNVDFIYPGQMLCIR